jgi:4-carboxymuconolactone decarboxylase
MTDDQTPSDYERGAAMYNEIYAGDGVMIPEGVMPYTDVMIKSLFAEVWARDVLSIRDRRLLLMGVLAAHGATDVWKIHAKAALKNGEITPDELRETLILLSPYAGFPVVSPLVAATEGVIREWHKERKEQTAT